MTDTTTTTETTTPEASAGQTSTPGQSDAGAGAAAGKTSAKSGASATAGAAATGTGAATEEFWTGFSDDKLKNSPVVLRHKTTEDLARSLVAAESRLGVPADQLLRLPTKDEDYPAIWKALGAPETAEGYKITLPEGASDEDKAFAQRFGEHMHQAGPFPPQVVKAAVDFVNAETARTDADLKAAEDAARGEGEKLLREQLGAAYDPDMKAVGRMLADLKIDGLQEELNASGLGNSPRLLLALHKIMDARGEPQALEGANAGTARGSAMTPATAKAARITLENDPIKGPALRDSGHAMHKAVVAERDRLFAYEAGRDPDKQA